MNYNIIQLITILPLEKYWSSLSQNRLIDNKSIVPITTYSMLKRVYHMITI